MPQFRTGYISIVGRPNVGKSTLLNAILDQKLSIVSRKPQTTRWNIQGIKTTANEQMIFIDTPGLQMQPKAALNRYMNKEVFNALDHIDVVLFMIESLQWNELDQYVLATLKKASPKNIILLINKLDKLNDKSKLLSYIDMVSNETGITEVLPVSANRGNGLKQLETMIVDKLPEMEPLYPVDQVTDRSERFFAAEFVREKLIARLGDELPYRLSITIEEFKTINQLVHIHACIWVEKEGQKSIVIGKNGALLKSIGTSARKDLEHLLDQKVNLKTWVKVKSNWSDSESALKQLGYLG